MGWGLKIFLETPTPTLIFFQSVGGGGLKIFLETPTPTLKSF